MWYSFINTEFIGIAEMHLHYASVDERLDNEQKALEAGLPDGDLE